MTARHLRVRTFAAAWEVESGNKCEHDHWDILIKSFGVRKDELVEMNDANVLSVATSIIIASSDIDKGNHLLSAQRSRMQAETDSRTWITNYAGANKAHTLSSGLPLRESALLFNYENESPARQIASHLIPKGVCVAATLWSPRR